MKKIIVLLALIAFSPVFLQGCKKDKDDDPVDGGDFGNGPRTAIPAELANKTLSAGSFSFGSFSNYDGSYAGQAFELAICYKFVGDKGDAIQYFYSTTTSFNCRTQTLGKKYGTVTFDQQNQTFKFYPANGSYRGWNSCSPSQNGVTKQYGSSELYPNKVHEYPTYEIFQENGKTNMNVYYDDGSVLEFKQTSSPE